MRRPLLGERVTSLVTTEAFLASRGMNLPRFFVLVVMLHAPSWFAVWILKVPRAADRPLVNLDLLAAAALACFSPVFGAVALVFAWAADGTRALAMNYHFMSTFDLVDAVRFLDMLDLRAFMALPLLGVAAGLVLGLVVTLRLTRNSRHLVLPLLVLAVLSVVCDFANGTLNTFGLNKDRRLISVNFAGSPTWNVWSMERQEREARDAVMMVETPSTFHTLRDWQMAHLDKSSMLILIESMGLPRDPALKKWLSARLMTDRLKARWDVQQLQETFRGSTTFGELRTLCGMRAHYSQVDDARAAGCLPRLLAAEGVSSVGIHGFGLRMFDRGKWWPRIGLQPWKWRGGGAVAMNCNSAFPGVCDAEVLAEAVEQAQAPGRFVYALTLDTHLPLKLTRLPPLPVNLKIACDVSATSLEACQLIHQLGDLLASLESMLATSGATPLLVVVGDHGPPFSDGANREAFEADSVPMFVLSPR